MTRADAMGLTSKANPLTTYALNLKLNSPTTPRPSPTTASNVR